MATYGCTSPFELNLDHICRNVTFVHNITQDWYADGQLRQHYTRKTNCPHPCIFLEPKIMKEEYLFVYGFDPDARCVATLIMPELVTVMKSRYTYTELSLIAEIGGHVGLFLGVSVLQVSGLMKGILDKLWNLADRYNGNKKRKMAKRRRQNAERQNEKRQNTERQNAEHHGQNAE